jgi:7-cyano-7-deazaguanine reductase
MDTTMGVLSYRQGSPLSKGDCEGRFRLVRRHPMDYTMAEERHGMDMAEHENIEVFDNPRPGREYRITIHCPEFTSVCPRTGQPDFGEITIDYCPNASCIELKSLKFYIQSYRNKGIFYEALTNDILDELSSVCRPRWMKVTGRFTPRGGITTDVVAEYRADS